MSTPQLHLRTCHVFDDRGRIVSTREPEATRGPIFALARGPESCAWAIRNDVPDDVAAALERLAQREPPSSDLRAPPRHGRGYCDILGARVARASLLAKLERSDGPAFVFPGEDALLPFAVGPFTAVTDEGELQCHFRGWVAGEIAGGRAPVLAIMDAGSPVSICFCARPSEEAAEAGLDTAIGHRGRGLGPRVAAAWALAVRASGRTPLYSTSWTNEASLAVARKLSLQPYASSWGLSD